MRLVDGEGPLEGVLGRDGEGLPDKLPPTPPGDTLLDPEVEGVWELDPPFPGEGLPVRGLLPLPTALALCVGLPLCPVALWVRDFAGVGLPVTVAVPEMLSDSVKGLVEGMEDNEAVSVRCPGAESEGEALREALGVEDTMAVSEGAGERELEGE